MCVTTLEAPLRTELAPLAAFGFVATVMTVLDHHLTGWPVPPAAALLFTAVFTSAHHHAETIARRVGQPFG